ncbi:hypothetical protein PIB30_074976 [Stylosanthes scabra]|uniref:F-box domain-containing protein n=1 Tax=Stylosanthes scabra TaxID=79078 RepID=A0ABU6VQY4_9FABA|nr:hypothetical protein [Stylosanthes scabra]
MLCGPVRNREERWTGAPRVLGAVGSEQWKSIQWQWTTLRWQLMIGGCTGRNNFPPALVTMGVIPEVKLLPEEIWVHIASLVAKESFPDLLTMKLTCKFFRSVAESDEVYKHARLVKLPLFACLRFLHNSERRLIKRCVQSGNPEAMFLKGH